MLNKDPAVLVSPFLVNPLRNYIFLGKYFIFGFPSATNVLENLVQLPFLLTQEYLLYFDGLDLEGHYLLWLQTGVL